MDETSSEPFMGSTALLPSGVPPLSFTSAHPLASSLASSAAPTSSPLRDRSATAAAHTPTTRASSGGTSGSPAPRFVPSHRHTRSLASLAVSGQRRSSSSSESGHASSTSSHASNTSTSSAATSVSSATSVESARRTSEEGTKKLSQQQQQDSTVTPAAPASRSLQMLRREVAYTPLSPRKPGINGHAPRLPPIPATPTKLAPAPLIMPQTPAPRSKETRDGSSGDARAVTSPLSPRALFSSITTSPTNTAASSSRSRAGSRSERKVVVLGERRPVLSTEEKKALLGSYLGNVDALVEGVRQAGVWGLA
jgi:hypothetical protein